MLTPAAVGRATEERETLIRCESSSRLLAMNALPCWKLIFPEDVMDEQTINVSIADPAPTHRLGLTGLLTSAVAVAGNLVALKVAAVTSGEGGEGEHA